MAQVAGYSEEELIQLSDVYVDMLEQAMNRTVDRVIDAMEADHPVTAAAGIPDVTDADRVNQYWSEESDSGELVRYLADVHTGGAAQVALGTGEAFPNRLAPGIVLLPSQFTTDYIQQLGEAQLDGVGAELWETVRGEILAGVQAGEGIPEITQRLRSAAKMNRSTAERVARTQVHAAAEAGSIAQVRFVGYTSDTASKEWIRTRDMRTRPTHVEAGGQTVPLDGKFTVGGWPMDHPGDYTAPASEKERCRCTAVFNLDHEPPPTARCVGSGEQLTAAVGDVCVSSDDNEAILRLLTQAQLRTRARKAGIPGYTRMTKDQLVQELVNDADVRFVNDVAPRLRTAAAHLGRLDQFIADGASERALRHAVTGYARDLHLDAATAERLTQLALRGDRDGIDALAEETVGLTRSTERSGAIVAMDHDLYQPAGDVYVANGQPARVVSPGYTYARNGQVVKIAKGDVITATEEELSAYRAEHAARTVAAEREAAARARQMQIDRASLIVEGLGDLDRVDAFIAAHAEALDAVTTRTLRQAASDPRALKRLERRYALTPVGTADAVVPFDPATMSGAGLRPGELVHIVRPGYQAAGIDETPVLLSRAVVEAASPEQVTAAEVAALGKLPVTKLRVQARERGLFVTPTATKAQVLEQLRRAGGQSLAEIRDDAVAAARAYVSRQPPPTAAQLRAVGIVREQRVARTRYYLREGSDLLPLDQPFAVLGRDDALSVEARNHAHSIFNPAYVRQPPGGLPARVYPLNPDLTAYMTTALDRQAELAPYSMLRLRGVEFSQQANSFAKYQPAQGFGAPWDRKLKDQHIYMSSNWTQQGAYDELIRQWDKLAGTGWRAPSGVDHQIQYTLSHEFGHHIMRQIGVIVRPGAAGVFTGQALEVMPLASIRPLLKVLDEQLGTEFMPHLNQYVVRDAALGGKMIVPDSYLDAVSTVYGSELAKLVSGYAGSGRFHELMAEIWQTYSTMGDAAPVWARKIGDVMRRLAEQAAKGA